MNRPAGAPADSADRILLPQWMRSFARNRETGMVLAGLVVGMISGVLVAAISDLSQLAHALLYDIPFRSHLSATPLIDAWRVLLVPTLGGAVVGLFGLWAARRYAGQFADAIEANALQGGRMSMRGSIVITLQTLLSNGTGGSVGLEAGYTQICAAVGSHLGRLLAARRSDMRMLVAAGAAGAISAAFSAPLAGSFYAFEVVLGAYTSAGLVTVIGSAVCGWLVARQLNHQGFLLVPGFPSPVTLEMVLQCVLLGFICALASILVMQAVATVERGFQAVPRLPAALRPVIGGFVLGCLALLTPVVLGAGHGAMQVLLVSNPSWILLSTTIILKIVASAVSLGSGFRGGLFFASLLLGALIGELFGVVGAMISAKAALQPGTAAIAALAAVGTGVIGAPFSMICLALEITGDFSVTVGAIIASSVSALIVRELFGYNFATWRFHLRGEVIRGPQDVGWTRQLAARVLMRTDFKVEGSEIPVADCLRRLVPGTKQVILVGPGGRYGGVALTTDLMASETPDAPLSSIARQQNEFLLPAMTIKEIMDGFERTETDVLVVIDDPDQRRPIGTISESHVLRVYGEQLERRNQEMFFR